MKMKKEDLRFCVIISLICSAILVWMWFAVAGAGQKEAVDNTVDAVSVVGADVPAETPAKISEVLVQSGLTGGMATTLITFFALTWMMIGSTLWTNKKARGFVKDKIIRGGAKRIVPVIAIIVLDLIAVAPSILVVFHV